MNCCQYLIITKKRNVLGFVLHWIFALATAVVLPALWEIRIDHLPEEIPSFIQFVCKLALAHLLHF